jgi:hypothetical protein
MIKFMTNSSLIRCGLALVAANLCLSTFNTQAFTFSLQEQGGLTGSVGPGGGGSVTISPLGVDHWQVTLTDSRIGNSNSPTFSLAYTEPELVGGRTAYNNVQVLTVSPGIATFDVLSDEVSPYATVVPNGATVPIQSTDLQPISLVFTDIADTVPEPGFASLFLGGAVLVLLNRARRRGPGSQ